MDFLLSSSPSSSPSSLSVVLQTFLLTSMKSTL
jgi:hypothetical protein